MEVMPGMQRGIHNRYNHLRGNTSANANSTGRCEVHETTFWKTRLSTKLKENYQCQRREVRPGNKSQAQEKENAEPTERKICKTGNFEAGAKRGKNIQFDWCQAQIV